MYASGEFEEKEITDYKMLPTKDWDATLELSSDLLSQKRAYCDN